MNNIKVLMLLCSISCICMGCKSKPNDVINVMPAYWYEGVYSVDDMIMINDVLVDRSDTKERIWLLSDRTLIYIIDDAKNRR